MELRLLPTACLCLGTVRQVNVKAETADLHHEVAQR